MTSPSSLGMASSSSDVVRNPSMMMDDILKGNATAAISAVAMLMEVRGTDKMDEYLRDMLPPERFPFWARLPLARCSRRARQFRLRRLLDISTPSAEKDDETSKQFLNDVENDKESKNRRARRALFILLRNMSENRDGFTGISDMLAMAKRDSKDANFSSEEMLKRTPDLETPKYEVLSSKKGGFEIRRYEQFAVCSVVMNELKKSGSDNESTEKLSNPQLSGANFFGVLAGYLFGKNQEGEAMKMTTPVITEGEGDSRKMSFVLPRDYWEKESLVKAPKPLPDSAVRVSSVERCERAVLAFGGLGGKADVALRSKKLREILESDKEWRAVDDAPIILAQYNDPFTPPWKRRNEVSILVVPRQ